MLESLLFCVGIAVLLFSVFALPLNQTGMKSVTNRHILISLLMVAPIVLLVVFVSPLLANNLSRSEIAVSIFFVQLWNLILSPFLHSYELSKNKDRNCTVCINSSVILITQLMLITVIRSFMLSSTI